MWIEANQGRPSSSGPDRRALGRALAAGFLCLGMLACGASAEDAERPAASGARAEAETARPSDAGSTDARAEGDRVRTVSLAPGLTQMVVAVGRAQSIVGVDRFSAELPGVKGPIVLGGLFAPDLERLVELRPSLVLGVQSAQQRTFFEQLESRGTRVETFKLHELEEVLAAFERVGALVGAPDEGKALARRVREGLARVAASTSGRARPRVVLVVDREPLFVIGGGSFVQALIEAAGGENVFSDLSEAYPQVSLEALASRAPDLVLETTGSSGAVEAAASYWTRFDFVKRFDTLPARDVVLPSPELPRAARLLRDVIHPELREVARP